MLGVGLLSAFGGFIVSSLFPEYTSSAYGFICIGCYCAIDHFSHKSIFDSVFRNLNLGINNAFPILKRKVKKSCYKLYEFTLPAGLSSEKFISKQTEIEQFLGRSIEISYGFKNLLIKVFPLNEKILYDYEPTKFKGNLPILIGYDRMGNLVSVDLSQGEPHMYCGGETGSGKSTWLRSVLVNLILNNNIDLYLGDLKNGVEFNLFRNCSKVIGFATNEEEMLSMLSAIESEVKRRYKLFADNDVEDIKAYNKNFGKLKYQLVVIDEFASLMYEKSSTRIIETLAAKARACGIHLLIATQRPDAKVINGTIKANFGTVLGLQTLDGTNSQIIIGHPGLDKLRGKGHGILRRGAGEATIQAPYLATELAKELIKPYNIDKNNTYLPKPKDTPKISSFEFMEKIK